MTLGLMGNNELRFPELEGSGAGWSNVIQILKPEHKSASTPPRDLSSDLQNHRRQCQ